MHIKLNKEELKKLIGALKPGEHLECFLLLNGGLRSSKTFIKEDKDSFNVIHEIDDTDTAFDTFDQLMNSKKTNIPEALDKGAFYLYEYEKAFYDRNI